MSTDDIKYLAAERLSQILTAAAAQASLHSLVAIAAKVGVSDLDGLPVPEFYERYRRQEAERLLASASDHNPELVTAMKQLWEQMKNKPR